MASIQTKRRNQMEETFIALIKQGFVLRDCRVFKTYFLVSTDHGGYGKNAVSRWSSSWVRRYEFDAKL